MISVQRPNKKNDYGNSNPINNKTSTKNTILYNIGTAIRTAKRGFLSTYVQSGLTADNTQAAQRRSDVAAVYYGCL